MLSFRNAYGNKTQWWQQHKNWYYTPHNDTVDIGAGVQWNSTKVESTSRNSFWCLQVSLMRNESLLVHDSGGRGDRTNIQIASLFDYDSCLCTSIKFVQSACCGRTMTEIALFWLHATATEKGQSLGSFNWREDTPMKVLLLVIAPTASNVTDISPGVRDFSSLRIILMFMVSVSERWRTMGRPLFFSQLHSRKNQMWVQNWCFMNADKRYRLLCARSHICLRGKHDK